MPRLTKPQKSTRVSVLVAVLMSLCLVLVGLANGGEAAPVWEPVESVEKTTLREPSIEVFSKVESILPQVRPVSWAAQSQPLRVLKPYGRLIDFVTEPSKPSTPLSVDRADPRLQRVGRSWTFSRVFQASVGSDPWALHGVGFPNIETHGPSIEARYKPYRAVIDWQPSGAGAGDWMPVAAVYCMGLSAQEIAERAAEHERLILTYAVKFGISASFVKAVITQESCFDSQAVSVVGAEGLMQLMPETAVWLKVTDSADVEQNLYAGIRYLADLRKRFGTEELALAAYNAGPGNVERHGGIPPFKETQHYVVSVMKNYRRYAALSRFKNQRVSL